MSLGFFWHSRGSVEEWGLVFSYDNGLLAHTMFWMNLDESLEKMKLLPHHSITVIDFNQHWQDFFLFLSDYSDHFVKKDHMTAHHLNCVCATPCVLCVVCCVCVCVYYLPAPCQVHVLLDEDWSGEQDVPTGSNAVWAEERQNTVVWNTNRVTLQSVLHNT